MQTNHQIIPIDMFSLSKETCYQNKDLQLIDTIQTYTDNYDYYRYLKVFKVYTTETTCLKQLTPDIDYYKCLTTPTDKSLVSVMFKFTLNLRPIYNSQKQVKVLVKGLVAQVEVIYRQFGNKPDSIVQVNENISNDINLNQLLISTGINNSSQIPTDLFEITANLSTQITNYNNLKGYLKSKQSVSIVNETSIGLLVYQTATLHLKGYYITDTIVNDIISLDYTWNLSKFQSRLKFQVVNDIELSLN